MQRRPSQSRHGWPPPPRTAEAWIALPEIPLGRHLLADVGWVSSGRERAIAAGVEELPTPRGEIDDGYVALPAVTAIGDDGKMRVFRLPLPYAAIVRRFALLDERIRHDRDLPGMRATELPCHFAIGDRETVYLVPDDQAKQGGHLN